MSNKNLLIMLYCLPMLLLTACTLPLYVSQTEGKLAKATFSTLMPGAPELVLKTSRKSYLIHNTLIEKRKPAEQAKQGITLPSGKLVTFIYNNIEIDSSVYMPETKGGLLGRHIELRKQKYFETCSDTLEFIPIENKQYEISFAVVNGICRIVVKEIVDIHENGSKTLKDVIYAS